MIEILNLVDKSGIRIGSMEKMAVHRAGALHEAFSIFIFDGRGHTLLQLRARAKYHSGGLWSNACCGHARLNENIVDAAHRRLKEEMGFDCELEKLYSFTYRTAFKGGLIEHEFDHIFIGRYEGSPVINRKEADHWKWANTMWVEKDLKHNPDAYTYWFKLAWLKFF